MRLQRITATTARVASEKRNKPSTELVVPESRHGRKDTQPRSNQGSLDFVLCSREELRQGYTHVLTAGDRKCTFHIAGVTPHRTRADLQLRGQGHCRGVLNNEEDG